MSDPIAPLGCGTPDLQRDLNEAIGIREDASATRDAVEQDQTGHHVHLALEVIDAIAVGTELATHGTAAGAATLVGPLAAIVGYGFLIDHAYAEGDRRNLELMDDVARGALAALERRADDPAVRAEAARNPAFAEGIRRVECFSREHPNELPALVATVRASARGGMLAVARGEEDTEAFRERAAVDPAFAHGAGYMRRLRERDPEAFAQKAAWLEQLATSVEANRNCRVRG